MRHFDIPDHISIVSKDGPVSKGTFWRDFWYATVIAMIVLVLLSLITWHPVAHATTKEQHTTVKVDKVQDLGDQPDAVQERAYCQMWAAHVGQGDQHYVAGATGNVVGQFCLPYE